MMGPPMVSALGYARRGWPVFPCHAPVGRGCTCPAGAGCASVGKHPRTRHGLHDASTDAGTIKAWWRTWPRANVGIRTGEGLVVVDIDPAHGGAASIEALEAKHGRLPATLAVRTGGAGLHLYFAVEKAVRNSAGALGPGIDVRGEGGYVVAPPSRHVSGAAYRWSGVGSLAPMPTWVRDYLVRPEPPRAPVDGAALLPRAGVSAWAAAALAGELDRVAAAAEGQRNHTLNRAAFVLGQLVGASHLDRDLVAGQLARAGEAAGLGPREVAATVASGLGAGERWPRHPANAFPSPHRADAGVDLRHVELASPNGHAEGAGIGREIAP